MENLSTDNVVREVQQKLFAMQDVKYRDFQGKLIPDVPAEKKIGVRTPQLRTYAKELIKSGSADPIKSGGADPIKSGGADLIKSGGADLIKSGGADLIKSGGVYPFKDSDAAAFIKVLPHEYFDENQLHAFILSEIKDFDLCMAEVERFMPYVDNWATCDQMSPRVFGKHKKELLAHIRKWLAEGCIDADGYRIVKKDCTYKVRFAIGMLMQHCLDEDFDTEYPDMVASVRSDEYYVNMMIAWYFATALAKQYDTAVRYIEQDRLDIWTHNKAIQKAIESRRITSEQKEYLRSLKRQR